MIFIAYESLNVCLKIISNPEIFYINSIWNNLSVARGFHNIDLMLLSIIKQRCYHLKYYILSSLNAIAIIGSYSTIWNTLDALKLIRYISINIISNVTSTVLFMYKIAHKSILRLQTTLRIYCGISLSTIKLNY